MYQGYRYRAIVPAEHCFREHACEYIDHSFTLKLSRLGSDKQSMCALQLPIRLRVAADG